MESKFGKKFNEYDTNSVATFMCYFNPTLCPSECLCYCIKKCKTIRVKVHIYAPLESKCTP